MDLVTEINAALARCNKAGALYKLPDDYDCTPILEIDPATGSCTGIKCWRASIADHASDDVTPELATHGICRGPLTP